MSPPPTTTTTITTTTTTTAAAATAAAATAAAAATTATTTTATASAATATIVMNSLRAALTENVAKTEHTFKARTLSREIRQKSTVIRTGPKPKPAKPERAVEAFWEQVEEVAAEKEPVPDIALPPELVAWDEEEEYSLGAGGFTPSAEGEGEEEEEEEEEEVGEEEQEMWRRAQRARGASGASAPPKPAGALAFLVPATDAMELVEVEGAGRGFVAARRLEAGTTLVCAKPLAITMEWEEDEEGEGEGVGEEDDEERLEVSSGQVSGQAGAR